MTGHVHLIGDQHTPRGLLNAAARAFYKWPRLDPNHTYAIYVPTPSSRYTATMATILQILPGQSVDRGRIVIPSYNPMG